jgi:asparagine synthase (glutamine-hydrolysing)
MCGIAGSVHWDQRNDTPSVEAMTSAMLHRGPDAGRVERFGPAVLGHRRLSIIDMAASANQPMSDPASGMAVVFNGEIYNFKEIRRDLEALGATFRTNGDTEVLLLAYAQWGEAAVERLVGMFAFAIWDGPQQRLILARDRLGKKPLFYAVTSAGLVFASELPALRRHPAVSQTLDPAVLGQYLSLGYTLGETSVIAGVKRVPAAHLVTVEPGSAPRMRRYWDLAPHYRDKRRFASIDQAAEAVSALLDDAVRIRLVSDVPLGAFLSGGLDSALIVEAMARVGGGAVKGYTMGFDVRGFSEVPEAEITAHQLGVDHNVRMVGGEDAADLETIVAAAGEPFADTSMIPVHRLAAFAREGVTVALSGDGGDELFAGYVTYSADKLHRATRWLPGWASRAAAAALALVPPSQAKVGWDYKARQFLAGHALPFEQAHYSWRTLFSEEAKWGLVRPDRRDAVCGTDPFHVFAAHFAEVEGCHDLDRAMYVDIKTWLVDDILVKVDRMTMAASLEARAPLLDHRLVELAASLPVEWKMKGFDKKHILKRIAHNRLGPEILRRRKQGFNAPVATWLRTGLRELGRDATLSASMSEWLDRAAVERLWAEHLAGRADHGFRLFALTCLGLWLAGNLNGPRNSASATLPAALGR